MAQITKSNKGRSGSLRWILILILFLAGAIVLIQPRVEPSSTSSLLSNEATTTTSMTVRQYDFEAIGLKTGTDKVQGPKYLPKCLADPKFCRQPQLAEPKCRTGANHFYHTMYNARLGPLFARDDSERFQMLEIGFFNGNGYDAFTQFMPNAEAHSLEISCLPPGPRKEGKWPFGNFAKKNRNYQRLLDNGLLHCGDAADYDTLVQVWNDMRTRPNAPPLKLVIDDGAHISEHMAMTVFFWFPRIAPGGLLVIEDIQPINSADTTLFRDHFLPQLLKDVNYCGDPKIPDQVCFPTLHKFLQSVHCEMHICVLERNEVPAEELSKLESLPPPNVFNALPCLFGMNEKPEVGAGDDDGAASEDKSDEEGDSNESNEQGRNEEADSNESDEQDGDESEDEKEEEGE